MNTAPTGYGPITYKLIATATTKTVTGIEVPNVGEPYGELMTRNQAEWHAAQVKGTTYYNTASE